MVVSANGVSKAALADVLNSQLKIVDILREQIDGKERALILEIKEHSSMNPGDSIDWAKMSVIRKK